MKMRCAAIAVMAVFVMLSSSAVVAMSSESDADSVYDKYYYGQLTTGQKAIYDAYYTLSGNPQGSAGGYYYEVTVSGATEADAIRAWEASRLDDPYAFWTWSASSCVPSITVAGSTVKIAVEDAFADMANMVAAAKKAVESISISGSSQADRVKSINSVLKDNTKYKYTETGACTVYGIVGDGVRELSSAGFAAVFQALCDKSDVAVECMTVYGTYYDGSDNRFYAWNEVFVDKQVHACDSAASNKDNKDAWICAGNYTEYNSNLFGKMHGEFVFNKWMGVDYDFDSEPLCNDGYDWPAQQKSIADILVSYAPWIIIGLICIILAAALVIMARKEGQP